MTTILVVDDEECVRDVVRDVLDNPDCRVLEAADGASGMELARSQSPDVILLDCLLPGTSGVEVLHQLKQGATAHIPVILMSGEEADERICRAVITSGAGYLLKPFGRSDLLMKIREVITAAKIKPSRSITDLDRPALHAATWPLP
ncbi:MAG: response regulator [Terriglobales bacterium]